MSAGQTGKEVTNKKNRGQGRKDLNENTTKNQERIERRKTDVESDRKGSRTHRKGITSQKGVLERHNERRRR